MPIINYKKKHKKRKKRKKFKPLKRIRQIKLFRLYTLPELLLIGFVLWFGSYSYLYLYKVGSGPKPFYSYLLLTGFVATWYASNASIRGKLFGPKDNKWKFLFFWLVGYLFYGIIGYLVSSRNEIVTQQLITLVEAVFLIGAFSFLIAGQKRVKLVIACLAFLALVATAVNIWDFFVPTFSIVPGRAAGLYGNPNIAAKSITFAMVGGFSVVPKRLKLVYMFTCGIGILVTFSRGSWLIWGCAVIFYGWRGTLGSSKGKKFQIKKVALYTILGIGLLLLLFSGRVGTFVDDTFLETYLTDNTRQRIGLEGEVLSESSTEGRSALVYKSLEEIKKAPIIGHGFGYTEKWLDQNRPHNMYLLFLVEGGIFGLALYITLMVLLWRASEKEGRILAIQLIIFGIFTHNQLEQPASLMIIAFVFSHGAMIRQARRKKRRKKRRKEVKRSSTLSTAFS